MGFQAGNPYLYTRDVDETEDDPLYTNTPTFPGWSAANVSNITPDVWEADFLPYLARLSHIETPESELAATLFVTVPLMIVIPSKSFFAVG